MSDVDAKELISGDPNDFPRAECLAAADFLEESSFGVVASVLRLLTGALSGDPVGKAEIVRDSYWDARALTDNEIAGLTLRFAAWLRKTAANIHVAGGDDMNITYEIKMVPPQPAGAKKGRPAKTRGRP